MRGVFLRELRRIVRSPKLICLIFVGPVTSLLFFVALFGDGIPRDLPVAIVDADCSDLSRKLIHMIDASSGVQVTHIGSSSDLCVELLKKGEIDAYIVVPDNFESDIRSNGKPVVTGFLNSQFLLPASLLSRDLQTVIRTFSAGIEYRIRRMSGEPDAWSRQTLSPIRVDRKALNNPGLNYAMYLVPALFPAMMQIFILVVSVHAFASELRDGTVPQWLAAAGGRPIHAIIAKFIIYWILFGGVMTVCHELLFFATGLPFQGYLPAFLAGGMLFVAAYLSAGLALAAWTANMRLATSFAAFYSGPAFAFCGVTFPVMAMDAPARIWSLLLPLTHYIELFNGLTIRNASDGYLAQRLATLLGFIAILSICSIPRMIQIMKNPDVRGRE